MPTVEESVLVRASLAETWDAYFDVRGWPDWVDGFRAVLEEGEYPREGATLRWQSVPAGRGEVSERVLAHEPRTRHLVEFADPTMEGRVETRFQIEGEATNVSQRLSYRALGRGPVARLGAVLFVNSQVRASTRRTLAGFKRIVEEGAALAGVPPPR